MSLKLLTCIGFLQKAVYKIGPLRKINCDRKIEFIKFSRWLGTGWGRTECAYFFFVKPIVYGTSV